MALNAATVAFVAIIGERHPTSAFLLYVPPQVWLVPAALLAVPALLVSRNLFLAIAALAGIHLLAFMGLRLPAEDPGPRADALTIVTNNHGQSGDTRVSPFAASMNADVIALQEADWRMSPNALAGEGVEPFPFVARTAEFVVAGRHPVAGRKLIVLDFLGRRQIVAARFELDFHGRRVVLYDVHLPTPRSTLDELSRGRFLLGLLDVPGSPFAGRSESQRRYWAERTRLTRELVDVMAAETDPVIAVGDFNMPSHGHLSRVVAERFRDAHREAGGGFGFTFPGDAGSPLTLAEPWLRLDYIWVSPHWEVISCVTEKERPAQHRAVAARLRLRDSPPAGVPRSPDGGRRP